MPWRWLTLIKRIIGMMLGFSYIFNIKKTEMSALVKLAAMLVSKVFQLIVHAYSCSFN